MSKDPNAKHPNEPEGTEEGEPTGNVASISGSIMSEFRTSMARLHESMDQSYSASMAYMDRVVLLAGGTLTLTFNGLAMISSRLRDAGRSANDYQLIVAECWLLVTTIAAGLVFGRVLIRLRWMASQSTVLSDVEGYIRTQLSLNSPTVDVSKIPEIPNKPSERNLKRTAFLARIASLIVHLSLISAFICLAQFVQDNIGLILTFAPHGMSR